MPAEREIFGRTRPRFLDLAAALTEGVRMVPGAYRRRRGPTAIDIPVSELASKRLCFGGEFGYELLAWLPYLNFVAEELGVPLRTCSRPGSLPLYAFAEDHIEMDFTWRPDRYGSDASDRAFLARFGDDAVFPRQPVSGWPFPLSLGGLAWEHQDLHARLVAKNYLPLKFAAADATFLPDRPVAVINNKDFENWGNRDPQLRESFSVEELTVLRDVLLDLGYFVAYHPFVEPVQEDRFRIDDDEIFQGPSTLDMRAVYGTAPSADRITELQFELYGAAQLAVCPQGGNSFLPIMFGLTTLVLSTRSRLIEYQDLARMYRADVRVHTSSSSIVEALRWVPGFRPSAGHRADRGR